MFALPCCNDRAYPEAHERPGHVLEIGTYLSRSYEIRLVSGLAAAMKADTLTYLESAFTDTKVG